MTEHAQAPQDSHGRPPLCEYCHSQTPERLVPASLQLPMQDSVQPSWGQCTPYRDNHKQQQASSSCGVSCSCCGTCQLPLVHSICHSVGVPAWVRIVKCAVLVLYPPPPPRVSCLLLDMCPHIDTRHTIVCIHQHQSHCILLGCVPAPCVIQAAFVREPPQPSTGALEYNSHRVGGDAVGRVIYLLANVGSGRYCL
jgi:hypothetical protein